MHSFMIKTFGRTSILWAENASKEFIRTRRFLLIDTRICSIHNHALWTRVGQSVDEGNEEVVQRCPGQKQVWLGLVRMVNPAQIQNWLKQFGIVQLATSTRWLSKVCGGSGCHSVYVARTWDCAIESRAAARIYHSLRRPCPMLFRMSFAVFLFSLLMPLSPYLVLSHLISHISCFISSLLTSLLVCALKVAPLHDSWYLCLSLARSLLKTVGIFRAVCCTYWRYNNLLMRHMLCLRIGCRAMVVCCSWCLGFVRNDSSHYSHYILALSWSLYAKFVTILPPITCCGFGLSAPVAAPSSFVISFPVLAVFAVAFALAHFVVVLYSFSSCSCSSCSCCCCCSHCCDCFVAAAAAAVFDVVAVFDSNWTVLFGPDDKQNGFHMCVCTYLPPSVSVSFSLFPIITPRLS